MGGTVVTVGPFNGGLNLSEPPRTIDDNQLASCINFDIGNGGELSIRPGIRATASPAFIGGTAELLGIQRISDIVQNIIVQGETAPGINTLYRASSVHPAAWTSYGFSYAAGDKAGDAVQYNSYMWLPGKGPTAQGKRIDTGGIITTVAAMPKGSKSAIFKDRMFILLEGDNTVWYSTALDPSSWPALNLFKINQGDGDPLLSMVVYGDSLLFFKRNSTWMLTYDTDPGLGVINKISSDIGVSTKNSVTIINNEIYVINGRGIYRLINNFYEDISKNIDLFKLRHPLTEWYSEDFICPVGDKIMAHIYTAAGHRYFIYNLELNVWTEYSFPNVPGLLQQFRDNDSFDHYVAMAKDVVNLLVFTPYGDNPGADTPVGSFVTKFFDYGDPAGWKRLFWWSIEAASNSAFTMSVKSDQSPQVDTVQPIPASTSQGIFKAFLSRRFRTVQYKLTASGAFTFYSGQVKVAQKKEVSKRESI